ncbi:MAG: glucan biosynthesis protein, partial [Kiritimatiellia bacterium]|nr:glucan biosynthesis protein [Kiritimatiellia bacterium]
MNRSAFWVTVTAVCATTFLSVRGADPFQFDDVRRLAQERAATAYAPPDLDLPRSLRSLNYDDLRNIRFDSKAAIWRMERLPFQIQFFLRGGLRKDRITVHLLEGDRMETVLFSKNLFDYQKVRIRGSLPDDLGFSGFRIHYPLNRADVLDELIVFQGASYFRALGKGQRYGLSARGLALHVADRVPEEFPAFVEFWIEKPDRAAGRIRIYALLDSPSVTGAYDMVLEPGTETVMNVRAVLFPRKELAAVGVAPLTSMFWYGENAPIAHGDFRPEVHDSDGLLIQTGSNEWLWRPLVNENRIRYSSFVDSNPRGFGLLQRDRRFANYEDLEADYQDRPSVWVEPTSTWGEGEIRLVELPTTTEFEDNVVAYWAPKNPLPALQPSEFSYRLRWFLNSRNRPPLARVVSTRIGAIPHKATARRFVLDFSA